MVRQQLQKNEVQLPNQQALFKLEREELREEVEIKEKDILCQT